MALSDDEVDQCRAFVGRSLDNDALNSATCQRTLQLGHPARMKLHGSVIEQRSGRQLGHAHSPTVHQYIHRHRPACPVVCLSLHLLLLLGVVLVEQRPVLLVHVRLLRSLSCELLELPPHLGGEVRREGREQSSEYEHAVVEGRCGEHGVAGSCGGRQCVAELHEARHSDIQQPTVQLSVYT